MQTCQAQFIGNERIGFIQRPSRYDRQIASGGHKTSKKSLPAIFFSQIMLPSKTRRNCWLDHSLQGYGRRSEENLLI
jgi:hypothetical protein